MRFPLIGTLLGLFLVGLGLIMLLPALVALAYGEKEFLGLLAAAGATAAAGGLLKAVAAGERAELRAREALLVVAAAWVSAGLFGALPFLFCGTLESFSDAAFECISGFTTTGATVLQEIEGVSKGVHFWRALTQWLGGMGIIVLSVALLPLIGGGGMSLYRAEVPGHGLDKIKPRIAQTARTLWLIYAGLTALLALMLMAGGLDAHAAVCHGLTTMATGGFSTRNLSIESYGSAYVEWVLTLFMLLAGISFGLHFAALRGGPRIYWKNTEFRVYAGIFCGAAALVTLALWLGVGTAPDRALRQAAFQAASILTTTGFTSTDYDGWPVGLRLLLMALMFIGGCIGSTAGGLKVARVWLLARQVMNELFLLVHPRAVRPLIHCGSPVPPGTVRAMGVLVFLFVTLFFGGSVLLALLSPCLDPLSSMAATIACLGNIGPGLGAVGPHANYAHLSSAGKWLLSLLMLLGRLEIYTVLVLFLPAVWRR